MYTDSEASPDTSAAAQSLRIAELKCTFTKSARAKINAALISSRNDSSWMANTQRISFMGPPLVRLREMADDTGAL
jgi:hypothetical protein